MELKNGSKAAFGFGAFGKDVVYMLISSYLLYYYNVVLGMDSVFIGAMMMAARVFDAFNDPIMGIIVAKRNQMGAFPPVDSRSTDAERVSPFTPFMRRRPV
jgi:melibiose permease